VRGRPVERHRPELATPGPGEYGLPSTVGGVQAVSSVTSPPAAGFGIGDRPAGASRSAIETPGPGTYAVPSAFRSLSPGSAYGVSLRGRLPGEDAARLKNASPGPAAFGQLDYTALGTHPKPRTPGLSKGARMSVTKSQLETMRGPKTVLAVFDFNKVKRASPAFSMRPRTVAAGDRPELTNLGPAAYNLQGSGLHSAQRSNSPSWTMKARWRTTRHERDNGVPGPGAYGELLLPFLEMKMKSRAGSRRASPSASRSPSPEASLYDAGSVRTPSPVRMDRISKGPGLASLIMA